MFFREKPSSNSKVRRTRETHAHTGNFCEFYRLNDAESLPYSAEYRIHQQDLFCRNVLPSHRTEGNVIYLTRRTKHEKKRRIFTVATSLRI